MNKRASIKGIIIFIIALIIVIPLAVQTAYGESGKTCNFRSYSILKSVNSLEDTDTGLFSSGTIREKTLLFKIKLL